MLKLFALTTIFPFFNIVLVLPDLAPKEKVLIRLRQNDPDPLDPDPPDPDPPDPDPPH